MNNVIIAGFMIMFVPPYPAPSGELTLDSFIVGVFATLGTLGVVLIVMLWVAANWEGIEKFLSLLPRAVSRISHEAQLASIGLSIQSDLNLAISELDKETPSLFTQGVKVEWLKSGEDFAEIQNDTVVIGVRDTQDQDRAYVNSVIQLLRRCLMLDARRFLHGHVFRGIELILADRFFQKHPIQDSAQFLLRRIL